jgi:hypothetical protein
LRTQPVAGPRSGILANATMARKTGGYRSLGM